MKTVIMAGGYGTRLQPVTFRTPKCILPLGDKNSILHIIDNLSDSGIKNIIISLNKNQEKVKDYLESLNLDLNIEYCFEETSSDDDKLGAIGAVRYIVKKFGYDDYLFVGADNFVSGIDYNDFISFHKEKNADVSIALYELNDVSKVNRFGIGVIDSDERILRFQEKPSVKDAVSNLASTFIYFMNNDFLKKHLESYVSKELSEGRKPDNVGDLWAHFCKTLNIYGFKFNGFWGDVGQPDYYVETNRKALDNISKNIHESVSVPDSSKISGKVIIEEGASIGEEVIIIGPCVIGRGVSIGSSCMIGPYTTLLHDVEISRNNVITGSIIMSGVKTGNNVKINHAIIDGNTVINDDSSIHEHAMIGYNCVISSGTQVLYGSKIWPFIRLDENSIIDSKIHYPIHNTPYNNIVRNSCYWRD